MMLRHSGQVMNFCWTVSRMSPFALRKLGQETHSRGAKGDDRSVQSLAAAKHSYTGHVSASGSGLGKSKSTSSSSPSLIPLPSWMMSFNMESTVSFVSPVVS